MELWHISEHGQIQGPLSDLEITKLVMSGVVTPTALVWREGLNTWEPIALHFNISGVSRDRSFAEASDSPKLKKTNSGTSSSNLVPLLFSFFAGCICFAILFKLRSDYDLIPIPELYIATWMGLICGAALSGGYCIFSVWRSAQISLAGNPRAARPGLLKLACVFSTITLAVFVSIFLVPITTVYRTSVARRAFDKYEISVDVVKKEIHAQGIIGPGFSNQIAASLNTYAGLKSLIITSPGGLVDEGLKTAHILETQKDFSVVAHGQCNSACITILMGGNRRFADWDLQLGFHAVSPIIEAGEVYDQLVSEVGTENSSYLVSRGVPPEIVKNANSRGPTSMNSVYAIRLVEAGALQGLVDGSSAIALRSAKWRFAEQQLSTSAGNTSFVKLLSSIRLTSISEVEKHADDLFESMVNGNAALGRLAISGIVKEIVPAALASGDPTYSMKYLLTNLQTIRYFVQLQQWSQCVDYADGKGLAKITDVSATLYDAEMDALSALVISAGRANWQQWPLPPSAKTIDDQIISTTIKRSTGDGLNLAIYDNDARTKCMFSNNLMEEFSRQPPLQGVIAYRDLLQR